MTTIQTEDENNSMKARLEAACDLDPVSVEKGHTSVACEIDWLERQICFKPGHPDWEIIVSIIDWLKNWGKGL